MPLDPDRARKLITAFEFKNLFIEELGWNHHNARLTVSANDRIFSLDAVSEKFGMAAFVCNPDGNGSIPDNVVRRRIERQVAKSAHEHLIIYVDGKHSRQIWQWVRRDPGKPATCREHTYSAGQPGDSLIQKLQALVISLEEEEALTLSDVIGRARKAFDLDRVTKRFYDRFKAEHAAFLKFLEGIPDAGLERWYVSVMLNRLMFIYFIQKKGFLNKDTGYLKNKLDQCRRELGTDRFYHDLLCPLFFEGFAKRKEDRSEKARKLLGEVPYLDGGIFMPHPVEQIHGKTIRIPDTAFERLFEFFDAYHWHLDERPLRADDEINPDVLGYIFEKYINQKQMGAYYTKEDITEYIGKNTIIPYLFDTAREKCKVAFEGSRSVWCLLQEDPDRYLYEAVRRGVVCEDGSLVSEEVLPEFVREGMRDPKSRMHNRDYNLGQAQVSGKIGENLALPTETWREYITRRQRCLDLRERLGKGEIRTVNDLITYNLDIRQFAQDVIDNCEGPELLVAIWRAIESATVLDPTCGSGAFLFAALNILEPLYEGCLERMRFFLEEWGHSGRKNHPNYHRLFSETLKRVQDHPNHRYFVFKSIIVNNLYGVDLMEEAVEICKLRLFLKLVAQIEREDQIEPLPDIDFNIRSGNTLVGFVTREGVRKSIKWKNSGRDRLQGQLIFGEQDEDLKRIEAQADEVDRLFTLFRRQQTELGGTVTAEDKEELRRRLKTLTDELDHLLAGEYGVDLKKKRAFEKWRRSHQPFHWFAEFYGILTGGGFDVIIGNPPYVEYRKVKNTYSVEKIGYLTLQSENLYAFCVERSGQLLNGEGRFGMIVPSSAVGLDDTLCLRKAIEKRYSVTYISTYSIRPSKLFDGVDQRLCILLGDGHWTDSSLLFSTPYYHWNSEERAFLFGRLCYHLSFNHRRLKRIAQTGCPESVSILEKMEAESVQDIGSMYSNSGRGFLAHYHRSPRYWIRAMDFEQYFKSETRSRSIHHFRDIEFCEKNEGKASCAVINSTLFFFWFMTICNGRNLTGTDVSSFPFSTPKKDLLEYLSPIFDRLMGDYKKNSFIRKRADCEYQEFQPSLSKAIIDEIDGLLAEHYGFTEEELDFIVNFNIKYRMRREAGQDAEES